MAEAEVLEISRRDKTGKHRVRRMREAGMIPAVLYGHGEETISISVPGEQIEAAIRHGSHFVELKGELNESAIIKDIQWDTFGTEVLHVDLSRVSRTERVEVSVPIDLRGVAPGTKSGGIVDQPLHELEIECAAASIPDHFEVSINTLELNDSITAGDLQLPDGVTLLTPAEQVVVQVIEPTPEVEEEVGIPSEAEPELIGREEEQEEDSDS